MSNKDNNALTKIVNALSSPHDINTVFKKSGLAKDEAYKILTDSNWSSKLNDIADPAAAPAEAATNMSIALAGLKSSESIGMNLSSSFAGLAGSLSAALPLVLALGGAFAVIYGLTKYANQFNDAVSKTSESQSAYQETALGLASLNAELNTSNQRITELQALKDAGTISLAEESELETLKLQNQELQRQIELKQQTAANESNTTVNDAIAALKLNRTKDLTQETHLITELGEEVSSGYMKTDILNATKNEIKTLSEYKEQRAKLLEEFNNKASDSRKSEISEEVDSLDREISTYTSAITDNLNTLNTLQNSFKDPVTGLMKSGLSDEAINYYNEISNAIRDYANIDLSPTEKTLSNLNYFFDGSANHNFIRDALIDAAKAGDDLESVLKSMGLSLEDLGVEDVDTLNRYFKELASSADNASTSVKSLADTESIDNVTAAFNSKNAGYNYEQAIAYSQKAANLFEQGLVGTDDFKAFADYISYGMDDSIEAYQAGMEKFNRYFTAENDSGLQNFIQDFKEMRSLGEGDDWISNIGNTAQLAKDMGIGIGAVEDILSRMEDYGYITSDQWHSSLEDLSEYKNSLSALEELYNSMDSGEEKESLGSNIEEWKANLQMYEDDLSLLDENAVIQIKFAYNNAQLQQEVDSIENPLPYYGSYHIFQHRVFHLLNKPLRVLRFFSLKEAIATINSSSVF